MPLHFEPRLPELHVDRDAIDAEYRELTGGLSDLDRERLSKTAARMAVLLKTPERVARICADVASHFQEKVAPNGFGAQVVTYQPVEPRRPDTPDLDVTGFEPARLFQATPPMKHAVSAPTPALVSSPASARSDRADARPCRLRPYQRRSPAQEHPMLQAALERTRLRTLSCRAPRPDAYRPSHTCARKYAPPLRRRRCRRRPRRPRTRRRFAYNAPAAARATLARFTCLGHGRLRLRYGLRTPTSPSPLPVSGEASATTSSTAPSAAPKNLID